MWPRLGARDDDDDDDGGGDDSASASTRCSPPQHHKPLCSPPPSIQQQQLFSRLSSCSQHAPVAERGETEKRETYEKRDRGMVTISGGAAVAATTAESECSCYTVGDRARV